MAKRKLSNFKIKAIAMTDSSQGGPCSLLPEPVLLKNLKEGRELTKEQKELLVSLGYTESDISKSMSGKEPPSSSEENGEDDKNLEKGTDNNMSEDIVKAQEARIASLEKQLVKSAVSPFEFGELEDGVVAALTSLDEDTRSALTKAFEFLVDCSEYAVAVAVEKAKESVEKSSGEENPLKKALETEEGIEGGDAEAPVELTHQEKVAKELKELQDKENK